MIQNPHNGKFILLAGCDGSGKDTQGRRLEVVLSTMHKSTKVLYPFPKEPTKGPIGMRIYDILFDRDSEFRLGDNLTDFEFQKFFIRDRIEHYKNLIIPTLESGTNVICNRGIDSALAYGGKTIGDIKRVMAMHEEMFAEASVPLIWPDLIIIYDATSETAMNRMDKSKREKDAFENESKASRVSSNYRAIAALYPNCRLIDAELDGEEGEKSIFSEARNYIFPLLGIDVK